MDKLTQLQDKMAVDYKVYREKALGADKETLFNDSYYNAICGEWNCYLGGWFGDDGDSYFGEHVIDVLLELKNIYEVLVEHVGNYNTVGFDQDSFSEYLDEFVDGKLKTYSIWIDDETDDDGTYDVEVYEYFYNENGQVTDSEKDDSLSVGHVISLEFAEKIIKEIISGNPQIKFKRLETQIKRSR